MGPSALLPFPPATGALGILELGTHSLKLHLPATGRRRPDPPRVEWDLGHEVFSTGILSRSTIEAAISQVHSLLADHGVEPVRDTVFGCATGAFRAAENTEELSESLEEEIGSTLRVLTEEEEASLLAQGGGVLIEERPAAVFDLGGGGLDLVCLGANGHYLREHLDVGATRVRAIADRLGGSWDERAARQWIEGQFLEARPVRLETLYGTGGTVKAIAQVTGLEEIAAGEILELERRMRREGPPPGLSPRRRATFLPGLMVVRRLLEHVGARKLRRARLDLGGVLLARLQPFQTVLRGPTGPAFFLRHLDLG